MSAARQLQSFFTVMYNRMVARALGQNPAGSGHIGSSNVELDYAGAGRSGNLGGGAIPIGSLAVYPDPNARSYARDGYGGNATVYTIIAAIARKFAYLPRHVYEIKDVTAEKKYKYFMKTMDYKKLGNAKKAQELFTKAYGEAIVTNKLSDLMERPNPYMGQDFFYEVLGSYYESEGECMIWCNRGTDADDLPNIDGPILEMFPLPAEYMEMVPDPLNVWGSLGWIFNVAGKRIPIDNENVIHIRKPNLDFDGVTRAHMRGMSPLRPGRKKLTEDESATDASVAINQNEGAKGVLYDSSNIPMTPTRETNLRNAVDRKVNNREMRGAVALLAGQFGYLDVSKSSSDMELETRKDNLFDRLCNLFQIPPDLFKTGQTYQNMIQARKDFITNKILPMASIFRDEIDRVVLPAFGLNKTRYTSDIDLTQIPELSDDMQTLVSALQNAWWMSPNERRQEMNLNEREEDSMDDIWISNTLVRMEDAAMPAQQPDSFDDSGNPVDPAAQQDNNDNLAGGGAEGATEDDDGGEDQ